MSDSPAWLTLRRYPGFSSDLTSWETQIFEDGLLTQEVKVSRFVDHDWGIFKPECRHESHIIELPGEEVAGLQKLVSQIDFDVLQEVCSAHIDDVGWQDIECRTSGRLMKYRGQLFWGWHEIQKTTSPHIGVVNTAVELWERVVRLSPFKDLVRPKPVKRPRGPGRYRKN
jgi:hypothetical protein